MEDNITASPNITSTSETGPSVDWVKNCELALGIIGSIGNILVCIIVLGSKYMKSMTNYFIMSLAVADGWTSLLLIFNRYLLSAVTVVYPPGFAGVMYCRIWESQLLFWVGIKCSVFNLVAVTLERYFAIVHPFVYQRKFTVKTAAIMIGATWGISFFSEIQFVFFHDFQTVDGVRVCQFSWPSNSASVIVGVVSFLSTYLIPIIIMFWCYLKIVKSLKNSAEQLTTNNASVVDTGPAATLLRARKKVIRVLLVVMLAFTICWTPNQFLFLFFNFGAPIEYASVYYSFFVLLAFSNSVINPIIYAFKYKQFRRGFCEVFCPRWSGLKK
ncbi:somatostatin receptor type 2-like [Ptychodera flava]|uniref:somatostatin receptor type 2-like n=1 Tax=Ptychodera flava TaxID=63121 RepID=UPI00396A7F6C